jgi:WD40 repeat protein
MPSPDNPINEILVYFVACVVIVYHYKINEQTHYIHHESEISAVCVSKSGKVASGERGTSPCIHIWSIKDLVPSLILKGEHKSDIYLLEFISNDAYLISCGKRVDTPIFIHNIELSIVVLSTHVDQFVRCILPINNLIGDFKHNSTYNTNNCFILLSAEKIYYYCLDEREEYESSDYSISDIRSGTEPITAGNCFMINQSNPDLKAYVSNIKV